METMLDIATWIWIGVGFTYLTLFLFDYRTTSRKKIKAAPR